MRTRQILCPTDFSETASHALRYAVEMANLYRVGIRLLHVMSQPYGEHNYGIVVASPEELEKQLQAYAAEHMNKLLLEVQKDLGEGLTVKTVIRSGATLGQILEEAEEADVGMIVVASHGNTGVSHLLNPSVAEGLANRAKCPVMVVK